MARAARIVHLDFKGLPLTPQSLCARLQTLRDAGATALLLEWEDMLPFSGELADCASPHAYSAAEVAQVMERAEALGLEVVPLVQTLGHLEFALKHTRRAAIREDPQDYGTLCPASAAAAALVESLLTQVLALHPKATRVHIGCDEPQLGTNALTTAAAAEDPDGLLGVLVRHVTSTVGVAKALGRTCLMWHDAAAGMGERCLARLLAAGPQLVVWDYRAALQASDAAPTFATRLLKLHAEGRSPPPLLATAYKGGDACDGVLPDEEARRGNQLAWRAWSAEAGAAGGGGGGGEVAGVVLTGWSRFGHLMPLTEPLAAGMPSLLGALASWSYPLHLRSSQPPGGGVEGGGGAVAAEEAAAKAKEAAAVEEATQGAVSLWRLAAGDDAALHSVCSKLQACARHVHGMCTACAHGCMHMACTRHAHAVHTWHYAGGATQAERARRGVAHTDATRHRARARAAAGAPRGRRGGHAAAGAALALTLALAPIHLHPHFSLTPCPNPISLTLTLALPLPPPPPAAILNQELRELGDRATTLMGAEVFRGGDAAEWHAAKVGEPLRRAKRLAADAARRAPPSVGRLAGSRLSACLSACLSVDCGFVF